MRDIVCLSEPSSPAGFSPRKPIIKPFRSLQELPHVQGHNKAISALKTTGGNTISMANEHFGISKLPVKLSKAASDSSIHTNTSARNRALSYAATPPDTHPLALKHSWEDNGTKAVKRSDSQSVLSQTESPKHQLTPIPLSSAMHEMRFIFPDVPCDTNSNFNQPDILLQQENSACIAPVPQKRKMSSISVEMDPILEEEDDETELISPSSCVVDDVKSHSNAANGNSNNNAIMDTAAVSHSHRELPVVRVELTTAYYPDCSSTSTCSSPTHHSKTETLLNSSIVATHTTAQSHTMKSPHKPYMVAKQHGSMHSCNPQGERDDGSAQDPLCEQPTSPAVVVKQQDSSHGSPQMHRDDSSLKNTLLEQILPPEIANQSQHDGTLSCTHGEDYKREEDTLCEQSSSPMLVKLHDSSAKHCGSWIPKHGEDSSIKECLYCEQPSSQMVAKQFGKTCDSPQCKNATHKQSTPQDQVVAKQPGRIHHSPQAHREDCKSKDTILCEQSPLLIAKQHRSTQCCSPQTHREESSTANTLHKQPHLPPDVMTTSYDCSTASGARSQKGMPCCKDTDNTPQVGFSHSSTHTELSTNKTGVHSRSLESDRTRTRCELRSKATTHNAGGTSMVHSKEVIACEQLCPPEVASSPKEARCVAAARFVGLARSDQYNNGKESNSTPPQEGKQLEDDLCHGPCNQASSLIQLKSKLDHLPVPLGFGQQNRGTLLTSLYESLERHARNRDYNNSKSGAHRWRNVAAVQRSNPPLASSKPLAVSVSKCMYQPGNSMEEKAIGSNAPIDSEKNSTRIMYKQKSKQEGQGPGLTLVRRPNPVVTTEQPHCTKQVKPRDVALNLNEYLSGHTQTHGGWRSIDDRPKLQGSACTSKCKIPRRMCTSVQIGSPEATTCTGDECNSYGNRRGSPTATDGYTGKKTLLVGSVNLGRNSCSPLTKQDVKSQLTTSLPNNGIVGPESDNSSLLPKQAPKAHVGPLRGQNGRGTGGGGEEGENGSDRPTSEAASMTLVPASTTTRFNTALKTKRDGHDQTSTNENPILIRLASATDACTCAALSCSHESVPGPTIDQECDHSSQRIGELLAGSSEGKNEQQTKDCDEISADCETVMVRHDLNVVGIQHRGNAGSGTMHNNEGDTPSNYHHTKGHMLLPPKVRPKTVAVLHKTTSKFPLQNTLQHQVLSSSKVGGNYCEKTVPKITRKQDNKSNFKVNSHPMVTDITGTKVSECSNSTRNEDQIVHNPRGTNYLNEQENPRELETVSTYLPHPINYNIPKATSSNTDAVGFSASLNNSGADGLVPAQHKFSGMRTHTFSHPPDALPNATSQKSEQNNLGKAINVDNNPPTKMGKINRNGVSGPFHELNCPAGQPSVGRVAVDYANMTTCSRGPLPVAANSKLESLKPSHPNKQHANLDRPSPIKYTQTDI